MLTILSSASTSISLTPCVFLPCRDMLFAVVLISLPEFVIMTISSSSRTCIRPTAFPPFSITFIDITPLPPLPCTRYSSILVRLPSPLSVTVSSAVLSSATPAETTSSPLTMRMPLTPFAVRPISRTSSSLKRIERPFFVPIMRSLLPSVFLPR